MNNAPYRGVAVFLIPTVMQPKRWFLLRKVRWQIVTVKSSHIVEYIVEWVAENSVSKITVNYIFRNENRTFPLISFILFAVLASLVALWTKLCYSGCCLANRAHMERNNVGLKDCIYRPVKINTCILNEQTKVMNNCLVQWEIWSLYPAAAVLQSGIHLL